jgi:5'(3')-deoxyribonucleotidase
VDKASQEEKQYTIYCDIDGVLADFGRSVEQVMHQFGGNPSFVFNHNNDSRKVRDEIWTTLYEYQKKFGYIFWRNLDVMSDATELWNYIKKYHAQILSATGQPRYKADIQKRGWVTEHFGSNIHINFVQTAAEKAKFSGPDKILIDDQMKAINPWKAAGGVGIHHTSAASTIKQLKELGL